MDLMQRFAAGEIDAFETLVRQFQGEIYAWIVRIVRDPGIAEDLALETLWRAYRARRSFRPDGNFGAWVRRIATNLAIDHLRTGSSVPNTCVPLTDVGTTDPDAVLQRETDAKIRSAFNRLPPKLQVAATLALIEERPHAEIADALGISAAAVKVRVFRAARILRKHLDRLGLRP